MRERWRRGRGNENGYRAPPIVTVLYTDNALRRNYLRAKFRKEGFFNMRA